MGSNNSRVEAKAEKKLKYMKKLGQSKLEQKQILKNVDSIVKIGNELLIFLSTLGYDSKEDKKICEKTKFVFSNMLQNLDIPILDAIRCRIDGKEYKCKLALTYDFFGEDKYAYAKTREQLCDRISSYFGFKFKTIQLIIKAMNDYREECLAYHNSILETMNLMLENLSNPTKFEVFQLFGDLESNIKKYIFKLRENLKLVSTDLSYEKAKQLLENTKMLIKDGEKQCCIREDALRQFIWYKDASGTFYNPIYDQYAENLPIPHEILKKRSWKESGCL